MNHRVFYFLLLIPFLSFSQPYFTRIAPFPQENSLNYIAKVPGSNRIIAVGKRSTVLISDYYGNYWDIKYNPGGLDNNAYFTYICFIDSSTGFISGNKGVLKTVDSGDNWYEVFSNGNSWYPYDDIAFANQSTGFAVGVGKSMLKTTDAGETWEYIDSIADFNPYQIEFFDELTGIMTGSPDDRILKTTNGGATWELIDKPQGLPDSNINSLYFLNETTGFAFTNNQSSSTGYLLRTADTGLTWDTVYSNYAFYSGHFDFSNEMLGAMVPSSFYSNLVITTNDGGETWTEQTVPGIEGNWYNYACYNDNNVYIAGLLGKLFKSDDNGVTWERVDNRIFYGDIYQMQFLDNNTGFALSINYGGGVASSGLNRTDNGGETWSRVATLMNSNGAFCFIDENTGFFCNKGIGITIAKTDDGGETWTETDFTEIELSPYVMNFFDTNNGLIAGEGPILRTTDGGENWQEIPWSINLPGISDIWYKTVNEVFVTGEAVGIGAFIGKSVDGGQTWEIDELGNYSGASSIVFTNENTAFIACRNTTILKSTDGGDTWEQTTVNTSNYIKFQSLSFPSENIGYAIGDGNYENFFMTTDGGETWNSVNSGCSASFNSVHFFDEDNGLVGGGMGVLFSISDELIQFNPPQNIDGYQEYICPLNVFHVNWDAPDTTNAAGLIAYKVYRNEELIDSIPVSGFYGYEIVDTIGGNKVIANKSDFCYYVTAVYNNPSGESIPTEPICFNLLINDIKNTFIRSNEIVIYPNPVFQKSDIRFLSTTPNDATVSIYNLTGEFVRFKTIRLTGNVITMDLTDLRPGVYLFKIEYNGITITKKVIKK